MCQLLLAVIAGGVIALAIGSYTGRRGAPPSLIDVGAPLPPPPTIPATTAPTGPPPTGTPPSGSLPASAVTSRPTPPTARPAPTRRPSPPQTQPVARPSVIVLGAGPSPSPARLRPVSRLTPRGVLHIVQIAVLPARDEAQLLVADLRRAGFNSYVVRVADGYAVRIGAFRRRQSAEALVAAAHARGFPASLVTSQ